MRPIRLILFSFASFFLFVCLVYVSISSDVDRYIDPDHPNEQREYNGFPFLRNPGSLFAPSATISLTDDNSTYFAARPAAFGPFLPSNGLSAQIWVGSGFVETSVRSGSLMRDAEGELGCGDIPGWGDKHWRLEAGSSSSTSEDNTDDNLHYPLQGTSVDRRDASNSQDHQSAEQDSDMKGKIVLLSRGGCGFSEKVMWAERRGASAVIIGDNLRGGPLVRMSAHGDASNITIPSLFTSHTTAHLLSSLIPPMAGSDVLPSAPSNTMVRRRSPWRHHELNHDVDDEETQPLPGGPDSFKSRDGLWVTLSPTDMSASPFFNTLFVLVISPLFTLAIVYSMLLLRSRIRRRRWRAPKSVVERLPVHTYHALSRTSSATHTPPPVEPSVTTPLLADARPTDIERPERAQETAPIAQSLPSSSRYGSLETSQIHEAEKVDDRLEEWKRKYKGRQSECVVCLEEYVDGVSKVMSLPCGHEFHADCITPWLVTRRRTCPICKGDVVRQMGRVNRSPDDVNDMTEDEIQEQAAETFNDSEAASRPITPSYHAHDITHEDIEHDLESGEGHANVESEGQEREGEHAPSWISRNVSRGLGYLGVRRDPAGRARPASSSSSHA